ncbi:MAG: serine/threonine-protein kinase [Kofleriaceae bacterium]
MESGQVIGKYRLESRLGRGGMGEVWLAQASGHGGFAKSVVVKTLLPELANDPLFVDMLAHEARICAKLSHPNLIEVFDFSVSDGVYLLAMEHVVGRSLSHIIKVAQQRGIKIPVWFALRIAWECCRGLECAHDLGVIHCDLSPSNVMVTFTGVTKILDFGVAHSTARGDKADRLKGKFSYMAPERIKSLSTDARTDVYALGVMLYLLFTGRLPFIAENDQDLLSMIINAAPRPPSVYCDIDPITEQIILRAMQPEPSARYQSIEELLGELARRLDGLLGTFGQHDVAEFLATLFDPVEPSRRLTTSAANRDGGSEALTWQPDEPDELGSVDVVIESSEIEVIREPVARPGAAFVSRARASSMIQPLEKPDNSQLFMSPERERTSVQSLFGDRPSLAFGPSGVFDRSELGTPPAHVESTPTEPHDHGTGTESESRSLLSRPTPAELTPEPSTTTVARGGFGGYSVVRRIAETAWPWASSRTKSD